MNPSSSSEGVGRRAFLGAGAAALAGYRATAFGYPVNESLSVGVIGTGGRAQMLMRALAKIPGSRINAVCDIWDQNLSAGRELAGAGAFTTKDHRALLDRRDIDVVLIGAPDHQHVPLLYAACSAGKDVYVEKPLTHDLSEGPKALEAQNRFSRIVQVGMQQRSMPQFQTAYEIVKSGKIGKIHKVHLTWNRNLPRGGSRSINADPQAVDWQGFLGSARPQPFDAYRFRNWRWFWDFGGGILTDLMVHFVDVAQWYLEAEHPAQAMTMGDQFSNKGLWETPDTIQTLLRYPDQDAQIYFEGTFVNARNGAMLEFMGTEATLYLDRGRYEIYPELKKDSKGRPMTGTIEASRMVLSPGPKGQDYYPTPDGEVLHLSNWLECVRTRKRPNAPVEAGVSAASAAHLGNRALRSGQAAAWSAVQTQA